MRILSRITCFTQFEPDIPFKHMSEDGDDGTCAAGTGGTKTNETIENVSPTHDEHSLNIDFDSAYMCVLRLCMQIRSNSFPRMLPSRDT